MLGILTCCLVFILPAAGGSPAWQVGEELEYSARYGFYTAGSYKLSVVKGPVMAGRQTLLFRMNLATRPGFFFALNVESNSWSDKVGFATYRYSRTERMRRESTTDVTTYDHEHGTAQRIENGVPCTPIKIRPGTLDELAVIYFVRTLPLTVGQSYAVPVHNGKWGYAMRVTVPAREKIKCALGSFDCLRVEPRLTGEDGKPYTKGKMTLWLTNDRRHLPVRIRMVTLFGSLDAELLAAKGVLAAD